MRTTILASLLLFTACATDLDLGDEPETDEADSELTLGGPTTLTFYQHASLTGITYTTSLAGAGENESIKLVSKPDVEAAGLLNRISAVRLKCGSRDARVSLFDAWNQSNTTFTSWSYLGGHGAVIRCTAGQTVTVNLHDQFPLVADRVASAILITHARYPGGDVGFSDLFDTAWQGSIEEISDAHGTRTDVWLTSMRTFKIRQFLDLDKIGCPSLGAVFEIQVRLLDNHTFSASTTDLYVDYSEWDLFNLCHNGFQQKLEDKLPGAKADLVASLNDFIALLVPGHARYYFVPSGTLRQFALFFGDPLVIAPN